MIDTSIIIDHLRKKNKEKSILFKIVDLYNFHLSTIVEFELFAGATNEDKINDINAILGICIIHPLSSEIVMHSKIIKNKQRERVD
jgi:tRNA(fMet)-specific endonuclease VapC